MTTHIPVLEKELLNLLQPKENHHYIDATYGGGSMAKAVLSANGPTGKLIAFDLDASVIESAKNELSSYGDRVVLIHDNFRNVLKHTQELGLNFDGIYADLGISSDQLLNQTKGISFRFEEAPLDMRMGDSDMTAADFVNAAKEEDLATIFREYGEEPKADKIAHEIVLMRTKKHFKTVGDLLEAVKRVYAKPGLRINPATKVWQALRIAVNDELESIRLLIPDAFDVLAPGGRLIFISFHSLEDRIIKRSFKTLKKEGRAELLTKKILRPTREEILKNPRSRSAKLRALKKIR